MDNSELFKVGDEVTFNAFGEPIKAVIRKVVLGTEGGFMTYSIPQYKLEGLDKPLTSLTTGASIEESVHFKCPIKHPFKW